MAIINAHDLVPGDVVLLAAGDAVTADARLLEAAALEAAEAALTGESMPVGKHPEPLPEGTGLHHLAQLRGDFYQVEVAEVVHVLNVEWAGRRWSQVHGTLGEARRDASLLVCPIATTARMAAPS